MKKILLVGAIFCAHSLIAQVDIFPMGGSTEISGTTVVVPVFTAKSYYYMDVENTGSTTREIDIRRTIINLVPGTADEICWSGPGGIDGNCYIPVPESPVYLTSNDPSIAPGEKGILQPYHVDNGLTGIATYRYVAYDSNTLEDLDSIEVEFVAYANLEEIEVSYNVYPNPTEGELTIVVPENEEIVSIRVYNLSGQLVYNSILAAGQNTIDLGAVEAGSYIYSIQNSEAVLRNDRLIIQ
jgi:hypothetical protein